MLSILVLLNTVLVLKKTVFVRVFPALWSLGERMFHLQYLYTYTVQEKYYYWKYCSVYIVQQCTVYNKFVRMCVDAQFSLTVGVVTKLN